MSTTQPVPTHTFFTVDYSRASTPLAKSVNSSSFSNTHLKFRVYKKSEEIYDEKKKKKLSNYLYRESRFQCEDGTLS